jgi:hypothetical protein
MRKVAFLLLGFFSLCMLWRFVRNVDREVLSKIFTNPFVQKVIIAPLPKQDPQRDLENLLREKKIDIEAGPIASDSALLVELSSSKTLVVFAADKDLLLQVSSLQIVLNKLTIEGRKATKIDLRFKNPIMVY